MQTEFEYFNAVLVEKKPKTNVYDLISKDGSVLAVVKWYPWWRQYCVFFSNNTVWSAGCLNDVLRFLQELKKK